MKRVRYLSRPQRYGAVAVLVAVCLTALLSVVALGVDGGNLFNRRRQAQAAADAAAMAAAVVLYTNYPTLQGVDSNGQAASAAYADATANGFPNSGSTQVQVYIPPQTGPYAGKASYCEVIVTSNESRGFSAIFGSGTMPVKARAVSRGAWVAPNIGVIVLDYSGKGTLNDQGNGAITEVGAPVIVNSNNASAAIDTGNGTMSAPEFDITGGYAISGGGQLIGTVYTGVHPTPDPLAYLPEPSPPPPGNMVKTSLGSGNFQYDLYPGSYSNLPNFNQGDQVVFHQASSGNGGIFYLSAGGFNSQGANISMASNETGGMMLYNAGTGTNDKINITGNSAGSVNMQPLTNGPYTGITFFQARDASEPIQVAGNGSFTIDGTLYAAGAQLQATGNGSVSNIGSQYVTKDLAITGNGNVAISYNGPKVGRTRIITLVE